MLIKKQESRKFKSIVGTTSLCLAALSVSSCTSAPQAQSVVADQPVAITFDSIGCPTKVVPSGPIEITKSNGQKVVWQAVNTANQNTEDQYEIFFDPFVGKSLSSKSDGSVKSKPVDSKTPLNVSFKYTIVGDACPQSPLDPMIKVL